MSKFVILFFIYFIGNQNKQNKMHKSKMFTDILSCKRQFYYMTGMHVLTVKGHARDLLLPVGCKLSVLLTFSDVSLKVSNLSCV